MVNKKIIDNIVTNIVDNTNNIKNKNHDYFSRIRTTIRNITDSKEEYEALRDDILTGYDLYRKTKNRNYISRGYDGKTLIPSNQDKDIVHDNDGKTAMSKFSRGYVRDFSKMESCFDDGLGNLKKMDNEGIKYSWVLGKDGLILIKYDGFRNSYLGSDALPKNSKGEINTNKRIYEAEEKSYWEINDKFLKDTKNERQELDKQHFNNKITYNQLNEAEAKLMDKYKSNHMDECIENLNKNLIESNLVNQKTNEPLFHINHIKNGK